MNAYSEAELPFGHRPTTARSSRAHLWLIVVAAAGIVGLAGTAIGISRFRAYVRHAKITEARNVVGEVSRRAARAYRRDGRLCPSASQPIPAQLRQVSARKYQSTPQEWNRDAATRSGFNCLGFWMAVPQYSQYDYRSDGRAFTVTAHAVFGADGKPSLFSLSGHVDQDGTLVVDRTIHEEGTAD